MMRERQQEDREKIKATLIIKKIKVTLFIENHAVVF